MTTLYFVRHGQSLGNLTRHFLGHTDQDLSELGYKQAELLSDFLNLIDIDVIYSSDLIRAYNTVKPTALKKGMEIITSKNLREINAGDWEGLSVSELWEKYEKEYGIWKNDTGNATPPNGETVLELQKRVNSQVNKIVAENKDKKILIATHATPIRAMTCVWNGIDITNMKNVPWVTNASFTAVNYNDDGTYKIVANGFDAYLGENISYVPKGM